MICIVFVYFQHSYFCKIKKYEKERIFEEVICFVSVIAKKGT